VKKLYLALLLIFSFAFCKAQYATIPNTAFVNWLNKNNFSTCIENGNQLDTTCPNVLSRKTINFLNTFGSQGNIVNLFGIQYFKNIDTLICSFNQLNNLSILPESLKYLDCSLNNLASIDALPSGITYLECSFNQLSSLSTLPSSLNYMDCTYNNLMSLPPLPMSLTFLDCSYNSLTSLPDLPDSMFYLDITEDSISCLQGIRKINEFLFTMTNIKCIPDYLQVTSSDPNIDSLPLCSISNPNNCLTVNSIKTITAQTTFNIFPNPTHDIVNIVLSKQFNGCIMNLTDVTGGNILQKPLSDKQTSIDISGFAYGIYFIRISTAGETQTMKVVKE
jgi:hypothetical protein